MRRWTVVRHIRSGYRLLGLDVAGDVPRISSPVVEIDPSAGTARTESGRLYRLRDHLAEPGVRQLLLLRYWQRQFCVQDRDLKIVSPEDVALDLAPPASMRPS